MRIRERFNPRAPCGARLLASREVENIFEFQPTRPLRGATAVYPRSRRLAVILIHVPLTGDDWSGTMISLFIPNLTLAPK